MAPAGVRSRLAVAALVVGGVSAAIAVAGVIWGYTTEGEALLTPMISTAFVAGVVSLVGIALAIVALVRRARPLWMVVVGLVLNAALIAGGAGVFAYLFLLLA